MFTDNGIEKIYLAELKKRFSAILDNKEYEKEDKNKEALVSIREIIENFMKN